MAADLILDGATVVTMDGDRTEHAVGHVVVDGSRITAVRAGRWPGEGVADDAIGSVEVGKQADLALWRLDGPAHAPAPGRRPPVVEEDRLVRVTEESLSERAVAAATRLLDRTR